MDWGIFVLCSYIFVVYIHLDAGPHPRRGENIQIDALWSVYITHPILVTAPVLWLKQAGSYCAYNGHFIPLVDDFGGVILAALAPPAALPYTDENDHWNLLHLATPRRHQSRRRRPIDQLPQQWLLRDRHREDAHRARTAHPPSPRS